MIIRTTNALISQPKQLGYIRLSVLAMAALAALIASPVQGSTSKSSEHQYSVPIALLSPRIDYKDQAQTLYISIQKMADQLFKNLRDPDPEVGDLTDGIAVSSFVDLKKLTRTSSFGRYLAEQLMTEFQQYGFSVIDVRKGSSIKIQEQRGEYGLSRSVEDISPEINARTLITGTYTQAGDHILVNARVIDNKTAELLSSAAMLFPKNSLAELLLADSASASKGKKELTYMKRLEL